MPTTRPTCETFSGVVMFADISSYTSLAELLCSRGPEGAEQLSQLLNTFFTSYLGKIRKMGGEIACIAGDALLAYWRSETDQLRTELQLAIQCTKELHSLELVPISEDHETPRLHIGLSVGAIWHARLGGTDEHYNHIFAGVAVREACYAASQVGPGETLLTSHAQEILENIDDTSFDMDAPINRPRTTSEIETNSVNFPNEQEYDRKWSPQIRNIIVLFMRIEGLDESSDDALVRHQEAVVALTDAIRPYSDSNGELLFDDKGLVLKLCFGIPYNSHSDDVVRAIRAGTAISNRLLNLGLDTSAGVASGRGICTSLIRQEGIHYLTIGRFRHLAMRLMQHADHGMLCTNTIATLAQKEIEFIEEKPLQLKGIDQSITPFRYHRELLPTSGKEKIFNRTREKEKIDQCLNALKKGKGGIFSLIGEAGIGKSTLINYLTAKAKVHGIEVVSSCCKSTQQSISFHVWRVIILELTDRNTETSSKQVSIVKLLEIVKDYPQKQLLPLINAIFPKTLEESSITRSLSGELRVEATLNILSEIIYRCTRNFSILILEDVHWIDSASSRLLQQLARQCPHILLVLTSRPGPQEYDPQAFSDIENHTKLPLLSLSYESIKELVCDLLSDGRVESEVIDEVMRFSKGNAFFAKEYTLKLLFMHQIILRHKEWSLHSNFTPARDESIDGRVNNLIASRLDSCLGNTATVLKLASVAGDQFTETVIHQIYPEKLLENQVKDALETLVQLQLLVKIDRESKTYGFRHALFREGAYEQLPYTLRRDLHRRTAHALERLYRNDIEPHTAELAYHWFAANVPDKTVHYSDRAATSALYSGAYKEAYRLLSTCLAFTELYGKVKADPEQRMTWYRQRADALFGLGEIAQRAEEVKHVLDLANEPRPQTRVGTLAQAVYRLFSAWLATPSSKNDTSIETHRTLEVAMAYRHSTHVNFFLNNPIGAFHDSVSAVYRAKTLPPSRVLASAYAELGMSIALGGWQKIGERIMQAGLVRANQVGDIGTVAYVHMIRGLYAVGAGQWRIAEQSAAKCQDLCEDVHDHINWAHAETVRYWLSHYQGREAEAYTIAESLYTRSKTTGNRQHRLWSLRLLALSALQESQSRNALKHLEKAVDLFDDTTTMNDKIPTLGVLARAKLCVGDENGAREVLKEGLALAMKAGRPLGHASLEGYSALSEVTFNLPCKGSHNETWNLHATQCLFLLNRYRKVFPIGEPRYKFWKGYYYLRRGHPILAKRQFRLGIKAAVKLHMPNEKARFTNALHNQTVSL